MNKLSWSVAVVKGKLDPTENTECSYSFRKCKMTGHRPLGWPLLPGYNEGATVQIKGLSKFIDHSNRAGVLYVENALLKVNKRCSVNQDNDCLS